MNHIVELTDNIFIFIVAISVFFLLLVTGFMLYFVFRYSAKRNPQSDNITGSTTLEVLWTVIPLILVLMMFFYGWQGFNEMRNVPADAMVVKVTGRMWYWSYEYDNGRKSDTLLVLPVNRNVKFDLFSPDVNHSFFIPAYRMKEDVIPGRTNYMWINTSLPGEFDIMCAEYCGMNHSFMLGKLRVVPQNEFDEWVKVIPPPDTTKKDTLKTGVQKQDSLKTGLTDTNKTGVMKDTIRNVKDTLKKD